MVNVTPLTSVVSEMETAVVFEEPNVAVSVDELGTVASVQLEAVFQSLETGLGSQVALPAKLLLAAESKSVRTATAVRRKVHPPERSVA